MAEFTAQDVLTKAREIALAHPDEVYMPTDGNPACFYTRGELAGQPGCVFGQALIALGVPHFTLADADEEVPGIHMLLRRLGCTVNEAEERVLCQAQAKQDRGMPLREVFNV